MRILKTALTFGLGLAFSASAWAGVAVYSSLPPSPTYNLPSQPFEAQQTAEFGDEVQLAANYGPGTNYTMTVGLSDWAVRSTYMTEVAGVWTPNSVIPNVTMSSTGFTYPLTMTLYNVVNNGANPPTIGSVIATDTIDAFVAWDPSLPWTAPDGKTYNGYYTTVGFDFTGLNLPSQFIYGLSFNTQAWGATPQGVDGPYDSLNFALNDITGPTVGSEVNPGTVFWNTETAQWYTDGGAAGVGIFRQDQNWAPYVPAVEIDATNVPEPISMIFFGTGLVAVGGYMARRKMARAA